MADPEKMKEATDKYNNMMKAQQDAAAAAAPTATAPGDGTGVGADGEPEVPEAGAEVEAAPEVVSVVDVAVVML